MSRKEIKTKKMKKKLLGLITCLSILISTSCTQTSPGGSNTGGGSLQTSWSCDINGVNYSWSGVYQLSGTNDGLSTFAATSGTNPYANLGFSTPSFAGNRKIMIAFSIPSGIGSYNLNPSNFTTTNAATIVINNSLSSTGGTPYSNVSNGSMTVNVNTLSPNSLSNSGYAGAGLVTGTFSGTLYSIDINPQSITITNGQFSAVRLQ
jgi:hypothetical protein